MGYDPALDDEVTCYVCHTGRGAYWIKVPKAPQGKKRRVQKDEMIARIADAIENEQPPGEVSIDCPRPERLNDTFDPEDY